MASEPILAIKGLTAGYGNINALKGVDIEVHANEFLAILGPNGAGKSTLMKSITGILKPIEGSIRLFGQSLRNVSTADRIKLGLGVIPEGRQLFPDMTVRENLILGSYAQLGFLIPKNAGLEAGRVFDMFPRLRERQHQLAGTLSGGEAQMLAVGRALMTRPRLLICDEPSIGLSPMMVREVLQTLTRLHRDGTAIVLADQNAMAVLRSANRGYILDTGSVVANGTSQELLNDNRLRTTYLGADTKRD